MVRSLADFSVPVVSKTPGSGLSTAGPAERNSPDANALGCFPAHLLETNLEIGSYISSIVKTYVISSQAENSLQYARHFLRSNRLALFSTRTLQRANRNNLITTCRRLGQVMVDRGCITIHHSIHRTRNAVAYDFIDPTDQDPISSRAYSRVLIHR